MLRIVEDLAADWRRLDERIEALSGELVTFEFARRARQRHRRILGVKRKYYCSCS